MIIFHYYIDHHYFILVFMADLSQKAAKIQAKVNDLYQQIQKLQAQAKNNLQKSKECKGSASQMYKQRCLMALKKKKALQNQVKGYTGQQNLLMQANFNLQNVNAQKEMYEHMKAAIDTQKQSMKGVDIDKMDELRDEMLDIKMQSDMMNEMMSRNYDMDIDQDEFEDQFMQFQKELAKEKKQINQLPNKQIKAPAQNNMNIDAFLK